MSTIYIVEDDSRISEALASLLSQYAYTPIRSSARIFLM